MKCPTATTKTLRLLGSALVLSLLVIMGRSITPAQPQKPSGTPPPTTRAQISSNKTQSAPQVSNAVSSQLPSMPLAFEPNVGQADAAVQFVAHSAREVLLLANSTLTFTLSLPQNNDTTAQFPAAPAANDH